MTDDKVSLFDSLFVSILNHFQLIDQEIVEQIPTRNIILNIYYSIR